MAQPTNALRAHRGHVLTAMNAHMTALADIVGGKVALPHHATDHAVAIVNSNRVLLELFPEKTTGLPQKDAEAANATAPPPAPQASAASAPTPQATATLPTPPPTPMAAAPSETPRTAPPSAMPPVTQAPAMARQMRHLPAVTAAMETELSPMRV